MQVDIIGVPIDLGADRRGVDMGPSAMRYAHLRQKLELLGKPSRTRATSRCRSPRRARSTTPSSSTSIASCPWRGARRARSPPRCRTGIFRSCWAAITAFRSDRCEARQRTEDWGCSGSMRMPTSTQTRPRLRATSTGCRWARCADWETRALTQSVGRIAAGGGSAARGRDRREGPRSGREGQPA